jgi:hypothetical protein
MMPPAASRLRVVTRVYCLRVCEEKVWENGSRK